MFELGAGQLRHGVRGTICLERDGKNGILATLRSSGEVAEIRMYYGSPACCVALAKFRSDPFSAFASLMGYKLC